MTSPYALDWTLPRYQRLTVPAQQIADAVACGNGVGKAFCSLRRRDAASVLARLRARGIDLARAWGEEILFEAASRRESDLEFYRTLDWVPVALAACGLDVASVARRGTTPLHLAVGRKQFSNGVAAELIALGAELDAEDDYGRTPVFYAGEQGLRLLAARGANLDHQDVEGVTAVYRAAAGDWEDRPLQLIQAFIELGADLKPPQRRLELTGPAASLLSAAYRQQSERRATLSGSPAPASPSSYR